MRGLTYDTTNSPAQTRIEANAERNDAAEAVRLHEIVQPATKKGRVVACALDVTMAVDDCEVPVCGQSSGLKLPGSAKPCLPIAGANSNTLATCRERHRRSTALTRTASIRPPSDHHWASNITAEKFVA